MNLAEHPTVRWFHERHGERPGAAEPPRPLDAAWLRQLCLDSGADDAGLVEISRPALDDQRDDILQYFPPAKTLLKDEILASALLANLLAEAPVAAVRFSPGANAGVRGSGLVPARELRTA